MPGTREGGLKASETNKKKYGSDFYKKIGATGGKVSRGGGFAYDPEMAILAGRLGGLKSRKGEYKLSEKERQELTNDDIKDAIRNLKEYRR